MREEGWGKNDEMNTVWRVVAIGARYLGPVRVRSGSSSLLFRLQAEIGEEERSNRKKKRLIELCG